MCENSKGFGLWVDSWLDGNLNYIFSLFGCSDDILLEVDDG